MRLIPLLKPKAPANKKKFRPAWCLHIQQHHIGLPSLLPLYSRIGRHPFPTQKSLLTPPESIGSEG